MIDARRDLVQRLVEQEQERLRAQVAVPLTSSDRSGVHYTELPEDTSNGPLAREWNLYRREVGRLLADGHEGRYVVIRGEDIIGIFDSWDTARAAGLQRFLREPFFVHVIRTTEPPLRIRGINQPWPNFVSTSAPPD